MRIINFGIQAQLFKLEFRMDQKEYEYLSENLVIMD